MKRGRSCEGEKKKEEGKLGGLGRKEMIGEQ